MNARLINIYFFIIIIVSNVRRKIDAYLTDLPKKKKIRFQFKNYNRNVLQQYVSHLIITLLSGHTRVTLNFHYFLIHNYSAFITRSLAILTYIVLHKTIICLIQFFRRYDGQNYVANT